jgi:CheY-like chemotaxis protein
VEVVDAITIGKRNVRHPAGRNGNANRDRLRIAPSDGAGAPPFEWNTRRRMPLLEPPANQNLTCPTFVIADGHSLYRAALKAAVGRQLPNVVIIEARSFDTLRRAILSNSGIDLIFLDLKVPGATGFSGLHFLRTEHPTIPVIVISESDSPEVVQGAFDLGASGFIPKLARIEAIDKIVCGVLDGNVCSHIHYGFYNCWHRR